MCYHSVHRQTKQKEPKSLLNYCLAGTKPHLMYQLLLTQTSSRTSRTITGRQRDIFVLHFFDEIPTTNQPVLTAVLKHL